MPTSVCMSWPIKWSWYPSCVASLVISQLLRCQRSNPHDNVIKWKHFPRYWPFVRGIHRSPVNSPHKGQWRGALMFSLICSLNKRFSKQSWGWWFETPSRSLWRHCNAEGYGWNLDVPNHTKQQNITSKTTTRTMPQHVSYIATCLRINSIQPLQKLFRVEVKL